MAHLAPKEGCMGVLWKWEKMLSLQGQRGPHSRAGSLAASTWSGQEAACVSYPRREQFCSGLRTGSPWAQQAWDSVTHSRNLLANTSLLLFSSALLIVSLHLSQPSLLLDPSDVQNCETLRLLDEEILPAPSAHVTIHPVIRTTSHTMSFCNSILSKAIGRRSERQPREKQNPDCEDSWHSLYRQMEFRAQHIPLPHVQ